MSDDLLGELVKKQNKTKVSTVHFFISCVMMGNSKIALLSLLLSQTSDGAHDPTIELRCPSLWTGSQFWFPVHLQMSRKLF